MYIIGFILLMLIILYIIKENNRNKLISKKYKILFNRVNKNTSHIVKVHENDLILLKSNIYKLQDKIQNLEIFNKNNNISFPLYLGIIQINSTNQCINSVFSIFYNTNDSMVQINKNYLDKYSTKYKKDSSYFNILIYMVFNNIKYMNNLKHLEIDFKYIKQNYYSDQTLCDFFDINMISDLPIETLYIYNCNPKYNNINNICKLKLLKDLQLSFIIDRNTNINTLYKDIYNDISKLNMNIIKNKCNDFIYSINASK
jgi:hypothetical protein